MIHTPYNNGGSRRDRQIAMLEQKLADFEMMKMEYFSLLHYLICVGEGHFDIDQKKLQEIKPFMQCGVLSKLMKDENGKPVMRFTRLEDNPPEKPIIISG